MLLLDTCALLWLASGALDESPLRPAIEHAGRAETLSVSATSAWELGLLTRAKRIDLRPDPKAWFETVVARSSLRVVPITPAIAIDASHLPEPLHNDPADRLIIATARHLAAHIVTRDRRIIAYAEAGYVQVLPC